MVDNVCRNCGTALKNGLLSVNLPLNDAEVKLINLAHSASLEAGCGSCAGHLKDTATWKVDAAITRLKSEMERHLAAMPLASLSLPFGWKYDTLGLVTAQTVTGTGLFSDVTSAFTDLFGTQSGAYNHKLRSAEELCRSSLRAQAYHVGGNAVLGVDVDYAEVGGSRAMLMVCMTGTAVRVGDEQLLGSTFSSEMRTLRSKVEKLAEAELIRKMGSAAH